MQIGREEVLFEIRCGGCGGSGLKSSRFNRVAGRESELSLLVVGRMRCLRQIPFPAPLS